MIAADAFPFVVYAVYAVAEAFVRFVADHVWGESE